MLPKRWLQGKQAGVHRRKTASGLQEVRTQEPQLLLWNLLLQLQEPAPGAGPVSRLRPDYNMVGPETGRVDDVAATASAYLTLPGTIPPQCLSHSPRTLWLSWGLRNRPGPGRLWGMWRNRLLPKNKKDEKCKKRKEGRGRGGKEGKEGRGRYSMVQYSAGEERSFLPCVIA